MTMDYINLGRSGLKVSRLCLGCMSFGDPSWRGWVLPDEAARPLLRQALDAGITFFDTADLYSHGESEAVLGRALQEFGVRRDQVVVATKVWYPMGPDLNQRGLSRKHILHAIDDSLRRLRTDYVDLYQVHRFDYSTPMEETLEALTEVVRAGKARYIGASRMFAWQFARYLHLAEQCRQSRFVAMQSHYNLIYREEEREMIPLCRAEGIGVLPWSPMARGFLAGNRRKTGFGDTIRAQTDDVAQDMYYRDDDFAVTARVAEVAGRYGVSNAQVALAWVLHQPGVTAPIIGATKQYHLADAIAALRLRLDPNDLAALAELYQPHPVLGHGYDGAPEGAAARAPRQPQAA
jgi:aryl-alcohol dehydrogenase-like predicted oxidoreductase